jgi:hypothetical protein
MLNPAQRGLASTLLGSTGEDAKLGQICTQEQADKPGFLEYCLRETLKMVKGGKLRGGPFGYLRTVIDNQWDYGDWVNPEVLKANADLNEVIAIYNAPENRSRLTDDEFEEVMEAIKAAAAAGGTKGQIDMAALDKCCEIENRKAAVK